MVVKSNKEETNLNTTNNAQLQPYAFFDDFICVSEIAALLFVTTDNNKISYSLTVFTTVTKENKEISHSVTYFFITTKNNEVSHTQTDFRIIKQIMKYLTNRSVQL